jgi:phytanoyl-CoA hydroxylase
VTSLLEDFRALGFARLGPVLDETTLAVLRARADDLMLGRVVYPGMFFQLDTDTGRYEDLEVGKGWQGPSLNYRKLEKLELDPDYRRVIEHQHFEPIARALSKEGVALYRAVLFNKNAAGGTLLPWHQDGGKMWGIDRDPAFQIWVALDDSPVEAGCLEIIPGSHKDGLATPLGGMVPQSIVDERLAGSAKTEHLPARAGEAILLHNYLWHRSGTTCTGRPRRALSICYLDAATRCVRKRHAPRAFVRIFLRERDHALDPDLVAG